ncbi:hypothetical protein [Dyella solisilvae]|uniref:hypothetical protein n=1 Tax=Dyella solisilvae TaxID=1920168 RepID=UPI0011C0781D|nr:hypothetical protein [Dyella solisilvae]
MALNRDRFLKIVDFTSHALGLAGIFAGLLSIAVFGGFAKGPTSPDPATGHVVPMQDHDRVFYVTWKQSDLLDWLRNGAVLCLVACVAGRGLASRFSKSAAD